MIVRLIMRVWWPTVWSKKEAPHEAGARVGLHQVGLTTRLVVVRAIGERTERALPKSGDLCLHGRVATE